MTRAELKSRLMTDAELGDRYLALFGARIQTDPADPDGEPSQRVRRLAFNAVMQEAAIVLAPNERTTGPKLGAYAVDDPEAHAAMANDAVGARQRRPARRQKRRVATWKFSGGAQLTSGGNVAGSGAVADRLRDDLLLGVDVIVAPAPGNAAVRLDAHKDWILHAWAQEVAAHLGESLTTDYREGKDVPARIRRLRESVPGRVY